jgi:hypothetical protein
MFANGAIWGWAGGLACWLAILKLVLVAGAGMSFPGAH